MSNDGVSRLRSLGTAFATTTFSSPSGSLTINGGAGSDSVELASVDSTFAGTLAVNFGAGSDTLRGALVDAVTLTNSDANGFDKTETSATTSFNDVEIIIGNGGTLTGQNAASTWTLNGSASTYSYGSQSLRLNGFTTLQGGSAADAFAVIGDSTFVLLGGDGNDSFNIAANLNGLANGEKGNDTLDGSGCTPVTGAPQITRHQVGGGAQILHQARFEQQAAALAHMAGEQLRRSRRDDQADGRADQQLHHGQAALSLAHLHDC